MQERYVPCLWVGEHHRPDVRVGRLQDSVSLPDGREMADEFCLSLMTGPSPAASRSPLGLPINGHDEQRRSPLRILQAARSTQRSSSPLPVWPGCSVKPASWAQASRKGRRAYARESAAILPPKPLMPIRLPAEIVRPPPCLTIVNVCDAYWAAQQEQSTRSARAV